MLGLAIVALFLQACGAWLIYGTYQRANRQLLGCSVTFFVVLYALLILTWLSPITLAQLLCLVLLAFGLRLKQASSRIYLGSALGVSALILVAVGVAGLADSLSLRKKYPIESLAARLDYEKSAAARQATSLPVANSDESSLFAAKLSTPFDKLYTDDRRATRLRDLHTSLVNEFVNTPGFGVSRSAMMWRRRDQSHYGPIQPIPQPNITTPDAATPESGPVPESRSPERELLVTMKPVHEAALVNFANESGFGWAQDVDHVAGFEPHAFHESPMNDWRLYDVQKLNLLKVELLSLLKHERPMVYDSANLPNMNELRTAPVRSLDSFERRALPVLQASGKDLVSEATGERIRMLGAIRAAKQCLNCHAVPHGALLGAFSYQLSDGPQKSLPLEPSPPAF